MLISIHSSILFTKVTVMRGIFPWHASLRCWLILAQHKTWLHRRWDDWGIKEPVRVQGVGDVNANDNDIIVTRLAQWDRSFWLHNWIGPRQSFLFRGKKSYTLKSNSSSKSCGPCLALPASQQSVFDDGWYSEHFYTWPIIERFHAELPWECTTLCLSKNHRNNKNNNSFIRADK